MHSLLSQRLFQEMLLSTCALSGCIWAAAAVDLRGSFVTEQNSCPSGQFYVDAVVTEGRVTGCFPAAKFTDASATSTGFNVAFKGYTRSFPNNMCAGIPSSDQVKPGEFCAAPVDPWTYHWDDWWRQNADYPYNNFAQDEAAFGGCGGWNDCGTPGICPGSNCGWVCEISPRIRSGYYGPSRAVDGNLCTNALDRSNTCGTCFATHPSSDHPTWTVDLGGLYQVQQVIIIARSDNYNTQVMQNFEVLAHTKAMAEYWNTNGIDTEDNICASVPDDSWMKPVINVKCANNQTARFVSIRKPYGNAGITFCEVFVIGKPLLPSDLPGIAIKTGNNGAASCTTYCRGSTWGYPYNKCVGAFDKSTARNISCETAPGVTAAGVDCWCSEPAWVKTGNNGAVNCRTYCAGAQWPSGPTGDNQFRSRNQGIFADCTASYIHNWMQGRSVAGVTCDSGPDGLGQECYCANPYPKKEGNDGSQTCDDYCFDYRTPPIYSDGCAGAYDLADPGATQSCAYKKVPDGKDLLCYCKGDAATILGTRPIPSGTCGDVCTPPPVNSPNSPKTDAAAIGFAVGKFVAGAIADGLTLGQQVLPDPTEKAVFGFAALIFKTIGNALTMAQTITNEVNKPDPYSVLRSQLDQDMKANSEYVICKVNSIVSSKVDGLEAMLADQDLDKFNKAVLSARDSLKSKCLKWNCLAYAHVDPANATRNAVAGDDCATGFRAVPNPLAGYTDCTGQAAVWNPDLPARCQYVDASTYRDGICGSDSKCYSVQTSFESVYAETQQIHDDTFNGPLILNFEILSKYKSVAGAVAMTKGAWLKMGLLQSMVLLGGGNNDLKVLNAAVGDVADKMQAIVDFTLDQQRLTDLIDTLSYHSGVPSYQAPPDHSCAKDSDCDLINQSPATAKIYNPAVGQAADTPSGQLVAGWGCAQEEALPQSVVCSLPSIKTTCQSGKCQPVSATSTYTKPCESSLKATIGAALKQTPQQVDTAWSQDPGTLMNTALTALKQQALDALTTELGKQLENVTALVPVLRNISAMGMHPLTVGLYRRADVGYPGYNCDTASPTQVGPEVPPLSTVSSCPDGHSRPWRERLGRGSVVCDAGSFFNTKGCCEPCAKGSFQPESGLARTCTPCNLGWTTRGPGATSAASCNVRAAAICQVGSYLVQLPATSSSPAQRFCAACPRGSFKPGPGNWPSCTKCKAGFTTTTTGARKRADCVKSG